MISTIHETNEPSSASSARIVFFPEGIPGFPERRSWKVLHGAEIEPFLVLATADEEPELRIVILDPRLAFEGYVDRLDLAAVRERLGLPEARDLLVYCVVAVAEEGASVNLRAPIVIDPKSMQGKQLILEDASLPLKAKLLQGE